MKLPSKITSYKESVLSKIPYILNILQNSDTDILLLYKSNENYFNNIEEFIDTLDCLFALKKIIYDEEREVLCYAV